MAVSVVGTHMTISLPVQQAGSYGSPETPELPASLFQSWLTSCSTALLILDLTSFSPATAGAAAGAAPSHAQQQQQQPHGAQWHDVSNDAFQEQELQQEEQLQVVHEMLLLAQAASGRIVAASEAWEDGSLPRGAAAAAAGGQQQQQQPWSMLQQQQLLVPARNPLVDKLTAQVGFRVQGGDKTALR